MFIPNEAAYRIHYATAKLAQLHNACLYVTICELKVPISSEEPYSCLLRHKVLIDPYVSNAKFGAAIS